MMTRRLIPVEKKPKQNDLNLEKLLQSEQDEHNIQITWEAQ
jgi:hypothetical protein